MLLRLASFVLSALLLLCPAVGEAAISKAFASSTTNLTATSYTQVDSMTLTPGAGDYLLVFSMDLQWDATGGTNFLRVSVFVDGTQDTVAKPQSYIASHIDQDEGEDRVCAHEYQNFAQDILPLSFHSWIRSMSSSAIFRAMGTAGANAMTASSPLLMTML